MQLHFTFQFLVITFVLIALRKATRPHAVPVAWCALIEFTRVKTLEGMSICTHYCYYCGSSQSDMLGFVAMCGCQSDMLGFVAAWLSV